MNEYSITCTWMNNKNGWKKCTKKIEHNMFTTNSYVLIQTLHVQNRKVCVNRNTTCSFPKKYVPVRNWNNMKSHILYTISTCFLLEFNLSNLLCLKAFLLLKESYCILSPSPPKLPSSIFSTFTICLQFLNIYFTMAKKTFTTMATPKTLETMIEYTLISNILDKICKMIKTPLEYPRDPTLLDPLK